MNTKVKHILVCFNENILMKKKGKCLQCIIAILFFFNLDHYLSKEKSHF